MRRIVVIKYDNHHGGGTFIVAKYLLELLDDLKYKYEISYIENNCVYLEKNGEKFLIKKLRMVPPFLQTYYQNQRIRKHLTNDNLQFIHQITILNNLN